MTTSGVFHRCVALVALGASCTPAAPTATGEVSVRRAEIRPTDGDGWHGNGYGDVVVESYDPPLGVLRLHYTLEGEHAVPAADADGDGVPDFVASFGAIFDKVYQTEIIELGLREPLSDATYHDRPDFGGDGRFDVYLQDQGGSSDGYIVTEACPMGPPVQCAGYMMVENDFVGYSYPTPEDGMKVLASHEFFHIVQKAHRADLDSAFSEGTAVWATERVFPEQDDFEKFIRSYFAQADRPLDDQPDTPGDSFVYSTAIWTKFLAERFGEELIAAIFEQLAQPVGEMKALDAVDAVLQRDQGSSLAEAFAEFALWNYLTGSRAVSGEGYAAAAGYPQVDVEALTDAHPFRISGEISYLSARYFSFDVEAGLEVTATVERDQPALAVHLVTGDAASPTFAIGAPGADSVKITSQGKVTLVAASTARRDQHLPLSIAIRATGKPSGGDTASDFDGGAPAGDAGVTADGGSGGDDGGGGCAVASGAASSTRGAGALLLALLPLALVVRRRTHRGSPRRSPGAALLPALAMSLLLLGCSGDGGNSGNDAGGDTGPTPDSGPAPDTAPPADTAPPEPDAAVPLQLGELVEYAGDGSGKVTGSLPVTGDETFILLLMSDDEEPLSHRDYTVELGPGAQAMKLPLPAGGDDGLPDGARLPARRLELPPPPCSFRQRLHEVLAGVAAGRPLRAPRLYQTATVPPEVGDTREFKVSSGVTATTITAEALAVDDTAVFWIDRTTQPAATIEPADLEGLRQGFAETIVPRERIFFGKESDIDGNGLIFVLLSPLVAKSAVAYVSLCDLIDPGASSACPSTNQAELLYLSPPSSLQPPYNTVTALLETAAHEFQHAIYFHRKYVRNNQSSDRDENPYITEGLSHLAQDLSGYQAGNLYVMKAALDQIDMVALPNAMDSSIGVLGGEADGVMRGAGYLLLRYLYDQAGGDAVDATGAVSDKGGVAWLRGFIDQPETGQQSVLKSAGMTYAELVQRFWTTMALSNRVAGGKPVSDDPRYSYLPTTEDPLTGRQRGCDLFGATHAGPITGPALQELADADGQLRGGGAELLRVVAPKAPADTLSFTVTTEAAAKPRVRLIRVR